MYKLFTHNDLDGVACAVLAKLAYKDDIEIEYTGKVNLTTDEKAMVDSETLLAELKPRIKTYVVSEFSKRLLNDN